MDNNPALQIQQLYQRFGELPGITLELHRNLVAVAVNNDVASATVFLQGAQVAEYQRHGHQPVLWLSPECDYRIGQALRGGIPICWPWFGELARNPTAVINTVNSSEPAPTHGLVRERLWQLADINCDNPACTLLQFTLDLPADELALWPYHCQLLLSVQVGESLQLALTVNNLSDQTLHYSSALHSYFAASAIEQVALQGMEGCQYHDCLQDWQLMQQQGEIHFSAETDRLYYHNGQTIIAQDKQWQRRIHIASSNSTSTVVWNPWQAKSKRLSCFADDAYQQMFCIETANAGDDFVTLKAGEKHSLGLQITASD
jgi:glucose-6-phosphate 1-epimerase